MQLTTDNYHEILVDPGHVSEEQFSAALERVARTGELLTEVFLNGGLVSDENLGRATADFQDIHFADLSETVIKDEYLDLIPQIVAEAQRAVVFNIDDKGIHLATENIQNYEFFSLLEKKTGLSVIAYYATTRGLNVGLKHYKGNLRDVILGLIRDYEVEQKEGDIIKLVDSFLEFASDNRASDIHIEPLEKENLIRFRVDGVLHEALRYPKFLHDKVIFRIKIMSRLQTDEHASAQDGRFEYRSEGKTFDVRVSILPITEGENVVMRLLDSQTHRFSLENIGLSQTDYDKVNRAMHKAHGMILAVGPTGSGKTTILYTILEKLNSSEVNIMTIEDPVEYVMEGVQQTQVNLKKDLTFATGLRSIVRQDPDIIMVGEIRDEETADIAINSALTGHLVISTLHTNDAATTFPRLMEMDVEPFLIASSVNLIVALRLVRNICVHCRESYIPEQAELNIIQLDESILNYLYEIGGTSDISSLRFYRGAGCKVCHDTGFSGRSGIFELLEVSDEIKVLITNKASSSAIDQKARELGMKSLLYDGLTKALNGTTTIQEVIKVAYS